MSTPIPGKPVRPRRSLLVRSTLVAACALAGCLVDAAGVVAQNRSPVGFSRAETVTITAAQASTFRDRSGDFGRYSRRGVVIDQNGQLRAAEGWSLLRDGRGRGVVVHTRNARLLALLEAEGPRILGIESETYAAPDGSMWSITCKCSEADVSPDDDPCELSAEAKQDPIGNAGEPARLVCRGSRDGCTCQVYLGVVLPDGTPTAVTEIGDCEE